ncbi:hypothetical protein [Celeribacter neptunius]|uniref:Uncharacterized protein n=1 Tax=Celeribacter neptunius TaxID=588602 RepID=A0A1I3LM71_9RHOB|nr:hypothetical protein [Celeribacter neptunius]SFI85854.1 hypothetical protein SAMN04487991_1083 [Celeribacter neptunius]
MTLPAKTVCVLGNSHMAAFVTASDQWAARWPEMRFIPFGAHGKSLECYRVEEGALVSDDAEARARLLALTGQDRLDLAGIDAFVVTGLQFSIFAPVRVFNQVSSMALPSVAGHRDAVERNRPLTSGALTEAYCRERLRATLGYRLARDLAQAGAAPVFLASQPRPAVSAREQGYKFAGFTRLHERGDGIWLSQEYDRIARRICRAAGVRYLAQPPRTIRDGLFTKYKFMRGSLRLAKAGNIRHPVDDVIHANADFARLMIDQLAAALDLSIVPAE